MPVILRLLINLVNLRTNLASYFFGLVICKILPRRFRLSKHLGEYRGNLLLLGKIGFFHNRRNASSRLLLLISKHLNRRRDRKSGSAGMPRPISYAVFCLKKKRKEERTTSKRGRRDNFCSRH